MFSFKFFVRKDNTPLRLRFVSNRKKAELRLGVTTTENDLQNALSNHPSPHNISLARLLKTYTDRIRVLQIELLEEGKADMEVSLIRDKASKLLLHTFYDVLAEDAEENDAQNWGKYYEKFVKSKTNCSYNRLCQATLNKMRQLCPDFSRLKFSDITVRWLNDLDEKLMESGISLNSRCAHFRNIRTCLNRAIDEELTQNYPFRRFKIRPEATRKRNLPVEELRRLFNYDVEEYQKYYLDYFKLIFFLIGINAIDLFNLTSIEDGRIEYRRAKTKKLYSIKVEPEAMEIINRHRAEKGRGLLDITDRWKTHYLFIRQCNGALKRIGKTTRSGRGGKKTITPEWEKLSTYWARHSWGTIAYSIDIPKDIISQALGHSSGSSITEIYIERDQKKVDDANRKVIDWVLYGKK